MNTLFIRDSQQGSFVRVRNFPTYAEAVTEGQRLTAYGFYVDTGGRVPTREEQLLLPTERKPRSHKASSRDAFFNSL